MSNKDAILKFALIIVLGASLLSGLSWMAWAQQQLQLPPFKCYEIRNTIEGGAVKITIKDQFGEQRNVPIEVAKLLCEPVSKAHPPQTPTEPPDLLPLVCYQIGGDPLNKSVTLADQFQTAPAKVQEPRFFCDPAKFKKRADGPPEFQNPPQLPPFKCYRVDGRRLPQPVEILVKDQFGQETLKVQRLQMLCEPATKIRGTEQVGPSGPLKSLTCYEIKDQPELKRKVALQDQFDLFVVRVKKPVFFCDPATKILGTSGGTAQALQLAGLQAQAGPAGHDLEFQIQGTGIESGQVQVFDLSGRVVYDSGFRQGQTLSWNLLNTRGAPVVSGVYLYVIYVRGFDGTILRSEVKKVVVLR